MTRYKLTLEYNGKDFVGWQKQPDHPSVQQAVEEAIKEFSGQEVELIVAGRTDAGVHARGQVAHVDLDGFSKPMDGYGILKAINACLRPKAISVINVDVVDDGFHARFDATNKLYIYRIINRPGFLSLDQGFAWHVGKKLDVQAMQNGANHLLGHHDFSTFRASECQAKTPMRTLDRLDIIARDYDGTGGKELLFETEGKSFLHHQVRNMVGTLVQVGLGKWSPEKIKKVLNAKDRTKGGPTAPAHGLYLMRVDYDTGE